MTVDPDERRPDHTRPTIAFITLAVAAAAVMTAGMTGNQPETPIAVDRPPLIAPAVPAPSAPPPPWTRSARGSACMRKRSRRW